MFTLRPNYVKVLGTLRSGNPKTSEEICHECGLDRLECVGAISILRRVDALAQAGDKRYRITERGVALFDKASPLQIEPRPPSPPTRPAEEPGVNQDHPQQSVPSSPPAQKFTVTVDRWGNPGARPVKAESKRQDRT